MPPEFRIRVTEQTPIGDNRTRIAYTVEPEGFEDWAILQPPADGARDWVVVIHGHGADGMQLFERPDIRDSRLKLFEQLGLGLFSPTLRGNAWMGPDAAADLHAWLNILRDQHGAERFFLISGSMGGTSNLIYTVLHPEDVAGVCALCPATDLPSYLDWIAAQSAPPVLHEIRDAIHAAYRGSPTEQPERYANHSACQQADKLTMPLLIVHGDADPVIPVEQSRALAECLRGRDTVESIELPGAGHDFPQDEVLPRLRNMLTAPAR